MATLLRPLRRQRPDRPGLRRSSRTAPRRAPGSREAEPARHGRRAASRSGLVDPLTGRERDVLRLLATELDGPAIARELVLSLNTVRTHTKNIYAKLGVTNRRAAVAPRPPAQPARPHPAPADRGPSRRQPCRANFTTDLTTRCDPASPHRLLACGHQTDPPQAEPAKSDPGAPREHRTPPAGRTKAAGTRSASRGASTRGGRRGSTDSPSPPAPTAPPPSGAPSRTRPPCTGCCNASATSASP